MLVLFPSGSIYSFFYTEWKTNIKITAFILYAGPNSNKVHALNLSAIQLSAGQRLKLISIISRLSKVPTSEQYTGRILYRIFRKYAPDAIRQCYRTYKKQYINQIAIVNYGLNSKEYMQEFIKNSNTIMSQGMFNQARFRLVTQMLNLYTRKGASLEDVRKTFATPQTPQQPSPQPSTTPQQTPTNTNQQQKTDTDDTQEDKNKGFDDIGYN